MEMSPKSVVFYKYYEIKYSSVKVPYTATVSICRSKNSSMYKYYGICNMGMWL